MNADPLAYLGAAAARAALAAGTISAFDYVSATLDRIARRITVNAFLSLQPERALCLARQADRRRAAGLPLPPLHGLPFAAKDMIDVRGMTTTAHSRMAATPARRSAAAILRLQRQGAICLGKLALEEFGIGSPLDDLAWPSPANPWDSARTPGGSSSGSAVALAAGLVPLALGTDTGGSVRAPAAYCGLTALKPSAGRVDLRGVLPLAPTLDTIGPMARSAADCALMFAALASPGRRGYRPGTIGMIDPGLAVDAAVGEAMAAAVATLAALGHPVLAKRFDGFAAACRTGGTILAHEAYHRHRDRLAHAPHLYGAICRGRLGAGADIGTDAYLAALAEREAVRGRIDALLAGLDMLALPVTFGAAPRRDDAAGLARAGDVSFRLVFNLTGHPALVFCTGFNAEGLPLSMQLVGRHGEDERLLETAIAYQAVTAWHRRRPRDVVSEADAPQRRAQPQQVDG